MLKYVKWGGCFFFFVPLHTIFQELCKVNYGNLLKITSRLFFQNHSSQPIYLSSFFSPTFKQWLESADISDLWINVKY